MKDKYVYCVNCKNFNVNLTDVHNPIVSCKYENECGFYDWEDGRLMDERLHYEEMREVQ